MSRLKFVTIKYLSFPFILWSFFCFFVPKYSYAFDEISMPSRQYNGSNPLKAGLPADAKPKVLQGVEIKENLGKLLDPNLTFTNQNGVIKKMSEIISDKPLILTLNYYRCSTLCSIQLVNLAHSMSQMGWQIGKDFNMATISFDPTDTVEASKSTQANYLSLAHQPNGNWNFYTGTEENIHKLTNQMGYFFKYDPVSKEYAHAAAIFFISPKGKISRYLYGINYAPNQLKFSLMDASENKIGSHTDQVLLTCFHYNPTSGKYDLFAINLLKAGAGLTVLVVAFFLIYFNRRDKIKFKKLS